MAAASRRITLWGVEVFVATVEEHAISAAAKRLGSSAATVSQQLTNLETALGTTLLNRNSRPVTPTPAGEIFLRRATAILREAEQARAELAMADLSRLTRLRLGMIEDFDADVTPRLLSEMGAELKDCQFLLETGASHRLFDLLQSRALDVVVASDTGSGADWMEMHPLFEEPFVVAAPKGALAPGDTLRQLQRLPMVQYTTRHHMGQLIASHLVRQNLTLAHRFELDSYHAVLAMVAAGAGWTILTPLGWSHAARFREEVELHPLPLDPISRRISLVARRDVLGDMPAEMAVRLRRLLAEVIVGPATRKLPWLEGQLHVLG
jgi:DNA-binding transcriptional LysR family regulator